MGQSGESDDKDNKTEMKKNIEEIDFQGDLGALQRLTEEGKHTLEYQLNSLNDIDSKAISILRINVLLMGLLFTAASFVVDSQFRISALDNLAFYVGIVSLLLSSALAALTYTASDSEVGIESGKINEVIQSNLTEKEFELAAAQSHVRWIWFNNRTNIINAPLITLTNILLIVALSHLGLGAYIALDGNHTVVVAIIMWTFLLIFIVTSNIIKQMNTVRKEIDISQWRPW